MPIATIDAAGNLRGVTNTNQALRLLAQAQAAQMLTLRGVMRLRTTVQPSKRYVGGVPAEFVVHLPGSEYLSAARGAPTTTNAAQSLNEIAGRAAAVLLLAQRALTIIGLATSMAVNVSRLDDDTIRGMTFDPDSYPRLVPGPAQDGAADRLEHVTACVLHLNTILSAASFSVTRLAAATGAHPVRVHGASDVAGVSVAGMPPASAYPPGDTITGVAYDRMQPLLPHYAEQLHRLATAYNLAAFPALDLPIVAV